MPRQLEAKFPDSKRNHGFKDFLLIQGYISKYSPSRVKALTL
jgi:hypothetical protein